MEEFDLYVALGLGRTASSDEIKQAYRGLARDLHPDRNPGNQAAEERFKRVSYAYQVLSDAKKRKLYDEFGHLGLREGFRAEEARHAGWRGASPFSGGPFSGGVSAGDFFRGNRGQGGPFSVDFESLFSQAYKGQGGRSTKTKGEDLYVTLSIDFLDAVLGCERSLSLDANGSIKTVKLRIPAGVEDGESLRLREQGQPSPYGPPGDLVLKVAVDSHQNYWREGKDLHVLLPVTALEAYRGAKVSMKSPTGDLVVRVPEDAQSGIKLRLRGKGVARKGQEPGDLIAHVAVQLPEKSNEVEELLEKLEALYSKSVRGGKSL